MKNKAQAARLLQRLRKKPRLQIRLDRDGRGFKVRSPQVALTAKDNEQIAELGEEIIELLLKERHEVESLQNVTLEKYEVIE